MRNICRPHVVVGKAGRMKALSIRQPWASLIVDGHKDVENRTWYTTFVGLCVIHAGKTCTKSEWDDADFFCYSLNLPRPRPLAELQRGGVLGYVQVKGCVDSSESLWFVGDYGIEVCNPVPMPFINHNGQLGFFEVPDELLIQHWSNLPSHEDVITSPVTHRPMVLNRYHLPNRGRPLPLNSVYIGRGTPWGNPFIVGKDPDPITQFGNYVFDNSELITRIQKELRGKHLVCSCAPRPCHGDILRVIANTETSDIDELVRLCRMEILIKTL